MNKNYILQDSIKHNDDRTAKKKRRYTF